MTTTNTVRSAVYPSCAASAWTLSQFANSMQRVCRIQQGLMKIRSGLFTVQLNYPWFKIRNGNGIGSF